MRGSMEEYVRKDELCRLMLKAHECIRRFGRADGAAARGVALRILELSAEELMRDGWNHEGNGGNGRDIHEADPEVQEMREAPVEREGIEDRVRVRLREEGEQGRAQAQ